MSKALDSGKSLMEGVLAKLPESMRESAKTIRDRLHEANR